MNFELLPIDETMQVLRTESDFEIAFKKIIGYANNNLPSEIWKQYEMLNIERDIEEAIKWLQNSLTEFPDSKGIYLGLDTLNMDEGNGTNVEIGLSKSCNPNEFSDDWAYDCEDYGESHLIKGLFEVADTFVNTEKWTNDETSFAEYIVFLGYSGVILREALNRVKTENDFLSIWGFHDGDMFLLTQKKSGITSIVTEVDL
jgi:hypothetical protein